MNSLFPGSAEAFEQLVNDHKLLLYSIAYSIAPHADADDIVQETFIHAYTHYGSLKDPTRLSAWLCAIARNKAIDCAKKASHILSMDVLNNAVTSFTPESVYLHREEHSRLWESISSLSDKNREVLLLFYFAGKNIREIAALLSLPEGSVKSRLSEGRKKLKKELLDLMNNERIRIENNDIFSRIHTETQRAQQAIQKNNRPLAVEICSAVIPEEMDLSTLTREELQILSSLYSTRGNAAEYTDHDAALADYTRSLEIVQESDDPGWLYKACSFYASQLSNRGRMEEAGRYYRLSLAYARQSGDINHLADALYWYGMHFIDEDGQAGFTEILSLKERLLAEGDITGLTAYTLAFSINHILCQGIPLNALGGYSSCAPGIRHKNGQYFSGGEPGCCYGKTTLFPDIIRHIFEINPFLSEEMRPGFCLEQNTFSFSSLPIRTAAEVLADDEELDTPAGRFADCLHVRYTNHLSEGEDKPANLKNNGTKDIWYAPDVGVVGIDFHPFSGEGWSVRLESYAVNPAADDTLAGKYLPLTPDNRWKYTVYGENGRDLSHEYAIENSLTIIGSVPLSEDGTERVTLFADSSWYTVKQA